MQLFRSCLLPVGVSFCVASGSVFARAGVMPPGYLIRPLVVAVGLAVVVGLVARLVKRHAVAVAALVTGVVVSPRWALLIGAVIGVFVVLGRIREWRIELSKSVAAGSLVFAVAGFLPLIPVFFPGSTPALAAEHSASDTPVFLILLDGYPRADTLTELGIDISPFIIALEERGFTHYPEAHSLHFWTGYTLTAMFGGSVEEPNRDDWHLPADFVALRPPVGDVTIPGVPSIGSMPFSDLEIELLGESLLGGRSRRFVMDQLRSNVDEGLDVLASTDEMMVFAHFLTPHTPFFYADGAPLAAPDCWPGCNMYAPTVGYSGLSHDEWVAGLEGTLTWLNPRLLGTVDAILERHPDARIALFSDHGGRYSLNTMDEWTKTFLAVRGPRLPEPRPDVLLNMMLTR